ncbi:hypothetical protein F5Y16DRAFT_403763 [Xylariaceae sp. FL0255]|nr:hypothetical protein F5Y16DRAFT_403763 [Xylariaceae sp. FL0255]
MVHVQWTHRDDDNKSSIILTSVSIHLIANSSKHHLSQNQDHLQFSDEKISRQQGNNKSIMEAPIVDDQSSAAVGGTENLFVRPTYINRCEIPGCDILGIVEAVESEVKSQESAPQPLAKVSSAMDFAPPLPKTIVVFQAQGIWTHNYSVTEELSSTKKPGASLMPPNGAALDRGISCSGADNAFSNVNRGVDLKASCLPMAKPDVLLPKTEKRPN